MVAGCGLRAKRFSREELEAMSLEELNRVTVDGPYSPAFYVVRLSFWRDYPEARLTFIRRYLGEI